MATITTDLICNLNQPVAATFLHGNLFSQDNAGNTINVYVLDNGAPATIGGTVSANVIRSDGNTVAVSGAIDGNKAYVILPQACYAVPGRVEIIIKLTQNTTITTIAAIVANVYRSTTDTVVDPGTIIPSISSLIAQIEAAVDSIPVDYSGLLATIAADYSSSKTYPVVGMYAWQAGVLKRNIVPITTAETYTAAHWTNAVIGDDLSALKSAFDINNYLTNNGIFEITQANLVSGVWGYTTPSANAKRLRTNMLIPVKQGTVVEYSTETDQMIYLGEAETETSGSTGFITTGWVSGEGLWVIPKDGFLTFNVKTNPEVNISVSDYDSTVIIKTYNRREMDRMLKQVGIDSTSAASVYNNDAKNLQPNTYSWILMSYFNDLPDDVASGETGWIISLSTASREDSIIVETQFLVVPNPSSNAYAMYYRRIQSGTMSAWKKTTNTRILVSSDLNDLNANCCVLLTSSNTYTHAPFALGTIYNIDFSSTLTVQYGFQFGTGAIWYRRKSTTWGDWINLVPNMDKYRTSGKYVAFGDSLTYGAVWSPTSGTALHRVKEEWRIPTRIALAIDMINSFANEAIGGIGYFKEQDGQTLISQITDYDFTGVELVTVMAGANDHYYTDLGTAADADTANTICGAIKNIIHTISDANPKTQIIVIQPLPCGIDGTQYDVWSSKQGDGYVFRWSLNEFDEQVSQLCHDEHVGYLNWWDSVMCRNWQYAGYNGSTGPNFTHPTVDEDYCLLGNFIAGKVSALYHGLN